MDNYNLKEKWNLWYHSINDNKWSKDSYKEIFKINNLFDYQYIVDTFKQDHYQNGMFFIMKDDIFPNWEDPSNRMGGCLSFKVPSKNIITEWKSLLLHCISDNILTDDQINGISISPKKEFNIIKLWIKDHDYDYKSNFRKISENIDINNSLYKKHDIN
jgi:hypothetical protein